MAKSRLDAAANRKGPLNETPEVTGGPTITIRTFFDATERRGISDVISEERLVAPIDPMGIRRRRPG